MGQLLQLWFTAALAAMVHRGHVQAARPRIAMRWRNTSEINGTPGWTPEVGYGAAPQTDCVPRACKESLRASAPCREIHRWLARQVEYLPGGRFQCSSYGQRLGEDACRAALGVSRETPRA